MSARAGHGGWRRWLLGGLFALACGLLLGQLALCQGENRVLLQLREGATLSAQEVEALRSDALFTTVQAYAREETTVAVPAGRSLTAVCWRVEAEMLRREQLLAGRAFFPGEENRDFAIVAEDTAQALFGRLNVVGETLRVDGRVCQVLGVLRRPGAFSERLARYGERGVYLLRREEEPVTHVEAALRPGISGDLALNRLSQRPALASIIAGTADLRARAGLAGLYARGFLVLYVLLLLRMIRKRLCLLGGKLWGEIRGLATALYPATFLRQAAGRLLALGAVTMLPVLVIAAALLWLGAGIEIPPSLIPARLALRDIREALGRCVAYVNSQAGCAHFLTMQWNWARMLILVTGISGLLILRWFSKRRAADVQEAGK